MPDAAAVAVGTKVLVLASTFAESTDEAWYDSNPYSSARQGFSHAYLCSLGKLIPKRNAGSAML